MIVFAAPSGSGKSTIVKHLVNKFPFLSFSISATTRDPRRGEVPGVNYYFLKTVDFLNKLENEEFLEYQEVYDGIYYGTLKSEVERIAALSKLVIFDIDVLGALSIKKIYGNRVITVFVKVSSREEVYRRLEERGTESQKSLQMRKAKIEKEMSYENHFDVVLYNDDLNDALKKAENLVMDIYNKNKWTPQ